MVHTASEARPASSSATGAAPRRGVQPALIALALGGFSIGTTEFTTMGLLPEIAASVGVSIPTAGHVITAYALGVVIGAPLLTTLAARADRRTLLLWLMGAFAVANTLAAVAPSAGWLVFARFLAGLPHGAFFGVGAVLGAHVAGPGRRGRAVATMMAGLTISNIVGVPASTWLGQQFGWRLAFVVVGLLGLLTLAALIRWTPSVPADSRTTVRSELGALRNRGLWIAAGAGGIGFGGMFAVYSYISPLLTEATGLGIGAVPLVLALFGVGMTAGTLLGGRLADRSVPRAMHIGFGSTILSLVAIGLLGGAHPVVAVSAIVALGVTSQILGIGLQSRLIDLSPDAPSLGAALCHSALNVGNAAGAWVGGLVLAAGLGHLAPAWVGAALTAAGLLVVATVGRGPAPAPSRA